MTEKELFDKLVNLEVDAMAHKEDVKAVKDEAKEIGFTAKDISLIQKSAKLYVANEFEEREEATLELFEKYKELTGYDSPNPQNVAATQEFLKQNSDF
jgi:uncharacterized protein (UPF0335 family)